jgi:hypothetical protein
VKRIIYFFRNECPAFDALCRKHPAEPKMLKNTSKNVCGAFGKQLPTFTLLHLFFVGSSQK